MQAEASNPHQNEMRRRPSPAATALLLAISFIIHNAGDNLPTPDEMCSTPGCLSDPEAFSRGRWELEIARDKRHIMRPMLMLMLQSQESEPLPCRSCFWVLGSIREMQAVDRVWVYPWKLCRHRCVNLGCGKVVRA